MKKGFGRIITMLRKEKGVSQCQAAKDLGISQALMSHYENGIRECSLEFVVKIADYYSVSCDYLLGRSSNRGGNLYKDDSEEKTAADRKRTKLSVIHALNYKIISDSIEILYEALAELNSKAVSSDVTAYFTASVYRIYRLLYELYEAGNGRIFSVPSEIFEGFCTSITEISLAKIKYENKSIQKNAVDINSIKHLNILNPDMISEVAPEKYTSLSNLIQNAEKQMNYKQK